MTKYYYIIQSMKTMEYLTINGDWRLRRLSGMLTLKEAKEIVDSIRSNFGAIEEMYNKKGIITRRSLGHPGFIGQLHIVKQSLTNPGHRYINPYLDDWLNLYPDQRPSVPDVVSKNPPKHPKEWQPDEMSPEFLGDWPERWAKIDNR